MTVTHFPEVSIGFAMRMAWRRVLACEVCGDEFVPEVTGDWWCNDCMEALAEMKREEEGGA